MKYRESEETYLETIYVLKQKKEDLHATDIASELNFSKPSVSRALGLLEKRGYVTRNENGRIDFTQEGKQRAEDIYERHSVITKLLIKLGASESLAEENACRIEHVICPELFEIIKKFSEKE
ncbi:MAG: metal-dependent transcriptional regulator [Clostridia bacterium]|nr:metal-dependent transcriptional regulator [Clostridia bacterium]